MAAKDIFDRLERARPPIEKAPEISAAQKLLDWLQRWPKDIINAKNIYQFGPKSIRRRQKAMDPIALLVRHGWLAVEPSLRRDGRRWRIIRRATIHPTVARQPE